ncbi:MAG: XRE family transcriptional regulator [Streptosporangiales bacterium]|nr:XRE family transcriptional regulator [Streptosporangiales bacterium]
MRGQHTELEVVRLIRARGLARCDQPADIARAIHERCRADFGTSRIRAYRLAYGVALADVVEHIRALYEREGKPLPKLGDTLLSAYESGHKKPGPEYLHYLGVVYRANPEDLGYEGPCLCGKDHRAPRDEPPRRLGSDTPEPNGTRASQQTAEAADVEERDDDVLRRILLQVLTRTGSAVEGEFLGAVDRIRGRMEDALVRATVSPTMLGQWEDAAHGYGRQYMRTAPVRLLCDILLDLSEARRLCGQRQPIELQERLCRVAAQLAGLSGIIVIDLGDRRLARSLFRTARIAADETGDRALRAWVTVREAFIPLYYGDPIEALELARSSRGLAGRTPSSAAAMAPVVEARALAQLARKGWTDAARQARRALVRGRSVLSRLSADDCSDPAFGYTERQLLFHEGDTLTGLGESMQAGQLLTHALAAYPSSEVLDRALIRFAHANCRLYEGDVDEALRIGGTILLDLPPEHRTDIVLRRAWQLDAYASSLHPDHAAARDFREILGMTAAR